MLSRIKKLNPKTVSQIAAGEVVENPASVLKELIENAIDARADHIQVFIKSEGFESIQIRDNGIGIVKDDLLLSLESFTTSKLEEINDIYSVASLGFRGEALGAIASVANILLESRHHEAKQAYQVTKEYHNISDITASFLNQGTRIVVSDLFYELPVRKEFQKKPASIKKELLDVFTHFGLAYPQIAFSLDYDSKNVFHFPQVELLSERIEQIFSADFLNALLPVYYKQDDIAVEGYTSNFQTLKSNPNLIWFFVNQRIVRHPNLIRILREIYGEMLPRGRFPASFLFLEIPASHIDVNVHPQKRHIQFKNVYFVDTALRKGLRNTIENRDSLRGKHLRQGKPEHKQEFPKFNFTAPLSVDERANDTPETDKSGVPHSSESGEDSILDSENLSKETQALPDKRFLDSNNRLFPQEFKLHGKLYNTFIMASSEDGIYLFDQHTVHERLNYEAILARLSSEQNITQNLISPLPLNLSPAEMSLLEDNSLFTEMGFAIEEIGPKQYGLVRVPFYAAGGQELEAFQICLKYAESSYSKNSPEPKEHKLIEVFKELAASMACRASIRKGESESLPHLQNLIERLQTCENPMRCPHGRPTMVFLGEDEISHFFKRLNVQ